MSIREFNNKKGKTYEVRFQYKDKYGIKHNYSKRGFTKLSEAKKHEKYMRVKVQEEDIKIKKRKWMKYLRSILYQVIIKLLLSNYINLTIISILSLILVL